MNESYLLVAQGKRYSAQSALLSEYFGEFGDTTVESVLQNHGVPTSGDLKQDAQELADKLENPIVVIILNSHGNCYNDENMVFFPASNCIWSGEAPSDFFATAGQSVEYPSMEPVSLVAPSVEPSKKIFIVSKYNEDFSIDTALVSTTEGDIRNATLLEDYLAEIGIDLGEEETDETDLEEVCQRIATEIQYTVISVELRNSRVEVEDARTEYEPEARWLGNWPSDW